MNRPESTVAERGLVALPGLLLNEDGPVFAEPWQAQAFALAVSLSAQGLMSSSAIAARREDWAEAYRRTPHGRPVELGFKHHANDCSESAPYNVID